MSGLKHSYFFHKVVALPFKRQSSNSDVAADLIKFFLDQTPEKRTLDFVEMACSTTKAFQGFFFKISTFESIHRPPEEVFSTMIVLAVLNEDFLTNSTKDASLNYIQHALTNNEVSFFKDVSFRNVLPPDVDCTTVGVSVLIENARLSPGTIQNIANSVIANTNETGIIQVYLPPRGSREGRIDPCVCANALFFLHQIGRGSEAKNTEDFVYGYLHQRSYLAGTRYYPSPDSFLFFVSRMLLASELLRARFEPLLIERISERIGATQTPLDCAMRLIVSNQHGVQNIIDRERLLSFQQDDGSFPIDRFFKCGQNPSYFGSKAVTSAFAARGLHHHVPRSFISETTIVYPFTLNDSGELSEAQIKNDLQDWCQTYSIFEEGSRESYSTLIAKYCRFCSPPGSSTPQLLLSAKMLSIFYVVNDTLASDRTHNTEFVSIVASGLNGTWLPSNSEETKKFESFFNGVKGFKRELSTVGLKTHQITDDFVQSLSKFSHEVVREIDLFGDKAVSLDDFHRFRTQNLFLIQYVEFWNIVNGGIFKPELREISYFNTMLNLAAKVVYIANDIRSLARDEKVNKPNYVTILKNTREISKEEAIRIAHVEHKNAVVEFIEKSKGGEYDPELVENGSKTFNNFLKTCIIGNIKAIEQCRFRYT